MSILIDTERGVVGRAILKAREIFATLPSDKVASVDSTLALDFREHYEYQSIQSQEFAAGRITQADAQTVYAALGEVGDPGNGGWASDVDTATKYAVTLFIQNVVQQRIGGRS